MGALFNHRTIKNILWIIVTVAVVYYINIWANALQSSNRQLTYYFDIIRTCGIFVTLAVSLNLINGITGQFSLGHAGFYAVGAYLSAGLSHYYLMPHFFGKDWMELTRSSEASFGYKGTIVLVISMLVGAAAAAIMGYIVGLPSLRLRGDYLAILTLGFGEIIRNIFQNAQVFNAQRGFGTGEYAIPELSNFFWIWIVAILCIAISRNLLKSAHGLAFISVREDEIAAAAMGVNTTRYKVIAFVLGAAFAGAAGALFAHWRTFIDPETFKMDVSITVVTMVVLGGQGSITGSIIAAIMLTALLELLRTLQPITVFHQTIVLSDLRMVFFALALIFSMLFRPQGLFGHKEFSIDRITSYFRRRRGAVNV